MLRRITPLGADLFMGRFRACLRKLNMPIYFAGFTSS
jgi:hypothetical protein